MTHPIQELSDQIWQAKQSNDMTVVASHIADQAKFVHMGITFDKAGELAAFNDKRFIYKQVDVAEEKLADYGQTAILFKKLILTAEVGGNEAINPFVVTEIFSQTKVGWQLVSETYTRIATDFDTYQLL